MKTQHFFSHFREAAHDLVRTPAIIASGLVLWVLIAGLSLVSVQINYHLTSSVQIIGWLLAFGFVSLSLLGFVFSGLIGWSGQIIRRKRFGLKDFFVYGKRFWFRNFDVMLMILVVSILIGRAAHFLAAGIGDRFNLAYQPALLVFVLVYFAGLVGVLIWFTFGNFMVVLKDLKAWQGVRASAKFVRKEFLAVLGLNVLLFVVFWLAQNLEGIVFELVEYGLIVPYLSLVLSRFVLK